MYVGLLRSNAVCTAIIEDMVGHLGAVIVCLTFRV